MKIVINNKEYKTRAEYQKEVYLNMKQIVELVDPELIYFVNIQGYLRHKLAQYGLDIEDPNSNYKKSVEVWEKKLGIN